MCLNTNITFMSSIYFHLQCTCETQQWILSQISEMSRVDKPAGLMDYKLKQLIKSRWFIWMKKGSIGWDSTEANLPKSIRPFQKIQYYLCRIFTNCPTRRSLVLMQPILLLSRKFFKKELGLISVMRQARLLHLTISLLLLLNRAPQIANHQHSWWMFSW